MLPALVSILLLAAGAICLPLDSPQQETVVTVLPVKKRQGATYSEYVSSNLDGPVSQVESRRYRYGDGNQRSRPQVVPEQTTPLSPVDTESLDGGLAANATGSQDGNQTSIGGSTIQAGGNSMIEVINKWRSAYQVNTLQWSASLVEAAKNTGTLNNGKSVGFQHQNPKDAAEVMAPGSDNDMGQDLQGLSPFELSYVALLCEVPTGPVADVCPLQDRIMRT
ncbi:MAG: hypothetical protein Q9223_002740 [Gallowayella weberi]